MTEPASLEAIEQARQMFKRKEGGREKQQHGPTSSNTGRLNVAAYLDHHGIPYKIKTNGERTIYCLDHCLFDSAHTKNEASIIQGASGKLYYQCFHDSCQNRTWHDARKKISGEESLARFCEGYETKTRKRIKRQKDNDHSVVESGFNLTDLGNAERFAAQHGQDVRFCHAWGKWLLWDGTRWAPDLTEEVIRKAKKTVRAIYAEASQSHDKSERKAIAKYAMSSESNHKIKAMLSLVESEEGIPVTTEQLDAAPMLFNCLNGTIDLKTGGFLPHNRRHLITKIAPVRYDPDATCPTWHAFLDRIMAGNQNLIAFIQRAVGYSLTGKIVEQILIFLFGTGANGKSTFMEAIRSLLGDYAQQTDFNTFLLQKYDTIRNDLARLKGARLVSAVEMDSGKRLAEVLVKQVTGGDTVTARFLHKEYFEFKPEFKIWLAANHKPEIRGTDYAIWRRIRLVPFNVTIPDAEQDHDLLAKLRDELPGILKWAVEGCLEWQRKGLGVPQEVWAATDEYKTEMDILSGFLTDRCLINDKLKTKAKELYQEYLQWCQENGEKEVTQRTFGMRLSERGLKRKRGTGGPYYWHGIGLLDRTEQDETSKSEPLNNSEPFFGIPHERDFI